MTASFRKFSTVEAHERRGQSQTRPPVGVMPLVPDALSNLSCWHPVPPPHNVVCRRRGRFQGVMGLRCLCTPIRRWTMRSDVGRRYVTRKRQEWVWRVLGTRYVAQRWAMA
jgi:hypothetical protein